MPIITSAAMTVSGAGDDAAAAMIRRVREHLQRHQRIAADHLADAVGVGALLVRAQGVERLDGFAQHRDLGAAEMSSSTPRGRRAGDQLGAESSSSSTLRPPVDDARHAIGRVERDRPTSPLTAPAPALRRRDAAVEERRIGRLHRLAPARRQRPAATAPAHRRRARRSLATPPPARCCKPVAPHSATRFLICAGAKNSTGRGPGSPLPPPSACQCVPPTEQL